MDKPLLNDQNEYPDDAVLQKYLGETKPHWDEISAWVADQFPSMLFEWRYYNDGKAWLCKLTFKKKTICWFSVWDHFFKLGFYFTDKTGTGISELAIDPLLKENFANSPYYGKLKALTVEVKSREILNSVRVLIDYKSKLK
ncbi:MAG: DUF3788 family protein [Prolixibacteraceae bacterium]